MKSVLVFYSGSRDAKAGHGTGESLRPGDDFRDLGLVDNWRRVLSNFHEAPFQYDGVTWTCIEEAFQAAKFGRRSYAEFKARVREVAREKGLAPGPAARQCRKFRVLDAAAIEYWDMTKNSVLRKISLAKFAQNPEALRVLKLTRDATLVHTVPRGPRVHFAHLEEIRDML